VAHVTAQGFTNADEFVEVPAGSIKELLKTLCRSTLPAGVSLPYLCCMRFRGLRLFLDYKERRGDAILAGDYTNENDAGEITRWTGRVSELDSLKDGDEIAKPMTLESWAKWEKFEEQVDSYLRHYRNPSGTPLSYVIRESAEVTQEIKDFEYATIDDDVIETTVLEGDQYELDNQRVFELVIKPFIVKGPGWAYAKKFARTRDGRAAYLAVKAQAEGPAAVQSRKDWAYAQIMDATFNGKGRFSFQSYIDRHKDAHNTLELLDEEVAEGKKVTDFLKGITDSRLAAGKDTVRGDNAKRTNFDEAQQYLLAITVGWKTESAAERRGVAAAGQGKEAGKTGRGRGKPGKGFQKKNKPRVRLGHYQFDEWSELSTDEQAQVRALRKDAKKRKASAATTGDASDDAPTKKVKIAAAKASESAAKPKAAIKLAVSVEEDDGKTTSVEAAASEKPAVASDKTVDTVSGGAGDQFGRFAHKPAAKDTAAAVTTKRRSSL